PIQVAARGLAQQLQRDLAPEPAIVGAVDDAGAARSEGAAHLEPAAPEERWRARDVHPPTIPRPAARAPHPAMPAGDFIACDNLAGCRVRPRRSSTPRPDRRR